MCDIYMHKCKKCKAEIDMHLVDFETGSDEIDVYCHKHIPKNVDFGVIWAYGDTKKMGGKAYIRSNTKNAKEYWDGNHPNFMYIKALSVFGKSPKVKEKKEVKTIKVIRHE